MARITSRIFRAGFSYFTPKRRSLWPLIWVTNPATHPHRIEYLRYEPDTPVTGPVRELPHIAFQVDNLDDYMAGEEIILGPFNSTKTLRVVFFLKDGAVFEFMENSGNEEWFKDAE